MNKLKEFEAFYSCRLKLLLHDKWTVGLFCVILILLLFITGNLYQSADVKSRVPIGLADEDNSELSDKLTSKVQNSETFDVRAGRKEDLDKMLKKQTIQAVFVINDNYEEKVKKGNSKELISIYYLNGDTSHLILSDIIAGEMMYEICLFQGINLYDNISDTVLLKDKQYSNLEYISYLEELRQQPQFRLPFLMQTVNVSQEGASEKVKNSVIYIQITSAISAMLLSMLVLSMVSNCMTEHENGIAVRLKTTQSMCIIKNIADILAIMAVNLIISAAYCIMISCVVKKINYTGISEIFLLLCRYTFLLSLIAVILSNLIHSLTVMQIIGGMFIIFLGFGGFISIIGGMFPGKILNVLKIFPNNWFIEEFTAIIVGSSL